MTIRYAADRLRAKLDDMKSDKKRMIAELELVKSERIATGKLLFELRTAADDVLHANFGKRCLELYELWRVDPNEPSAYDESSWRRLVAALAKVTP